jgi:hypothetical protein
MDFISHNFQATIKDGPWDFRYCRLYGLLSWVSFTSNSELPNLLQSLKRLTL